MQNANDIKFRASGVGHIMTDGKGITEIQLAKIKELESKSPITEKQREELVKLIYKRDNPGLSETTKTHLIDVFVSSNHKRREEVKSKYLDKGNEREEDAITLLSRLTKKLYLKNSTRLFNDFIQGEPDLFIGKSIMEATETTDTKCSWSAHTFFRAKHKPVDQMYYWQGQSYMWLTGAKKHNVAYCLVNGTDKAIMDEKRRLSFAMGIIDTETEEYITKCRQIEINHIFDHESFIKENPYFEFHNDMSKWTYDIPMKERMHTFTFARSESDIERIKQQVIRCRDYMNKNFFNV